MQRISQEFPTPHPLSYNVASAAAAVGVSVDAIKLAIREGNLPYSRINSKTKVIRRDDLDAWLLSLQPQPWTPRSATQMRGVARG